MAVAVTRCGSTAIRHNGEFVGIAVDRMRKPVRSEFSSSFASELRLLVYVIYVRPQLTRRKITDKKYSPPVLREAGSQFS